SGAQRRRWRAALADAPQPPGRSSRSPPCARRRRSRTRCGPRGARRGCPRTGRASPILRRARASRPLRHGDRTGACASTSVKRRRRPPRRTVATPLVELSAHAERQDPALHEARGEGLCREYSGSECLADEPLEVDADAAAYGVDLLEPLDVAQRDAAAQLLVVEEAVDHRLVDRREDEMD